MEFKPLPYGSVNDDKSNGYQSSDEYEDVLETNDVIILPATETPMEHEPSSQEQEAEKNLLN